MVTAEQAAGLMSAFLAICLKEGLLWRDLLLPLWAAPTWANPHFLIKLVGARLSIVDDKPGVTRDRIYGDCEWLGHRFLLVDTGGIEPRADDVILSQMRAQANIAIATADVIVLVTDLRSGVVATDQDVANMLQKSGKPVILCVNKCDSVGAPDPELRIYNLGMGDPIAVSAVHGHGTGDLLDAVIAYFPGE